MIRRCTIEDLEFVDSVLKHDSIYPFISDDNFPPVDEFTIEPLLVNPGVHVLTTNEYSVFLGVPVVNTIVYDYHVNILPEGRGKIAVESNIQAVDYLFHETECQKLISFIPELYPNVLKFALANGEVEEGLLHKSFLKNGKLYNIHVLGITKEQWLNKDK